MSTLEQYEKTYSRAIIKLLKGTVDRSSTEWDNIANHYQPEIQDYLKQIGLELIVKKNEGFAFVRQYENSEGNTLGLIVRRQIGFESSLVLVVLRQILEEFDSDPTHIQVDEKFITDSEIRDEVEMFLPEKFNRVKFIKELDGYIKKIVDLGYLREVSKKENETRYQIHRIIKEKVTLDILQDFKIKLQEYVESI
jgi:hypothetical protein